MPRIVVAILGALFGRDMKGGGSRLMMVLLLGIGWVAGDHYGLPDGVREFIHSNLEASWTWISEAAGNILPGE